MKFQFLAKFILFSFLFLIYKFNYSQDWKVGVISEFHVPIKKNVSIFLNRSGLVVSKHIKDSEIELGFYHGSGSLSSNSLSAKDRCTIAMKYGYGAIDGNELSSCSYSYSAAELVLGYKYHF